jgi:hypothetical protein
MLYFLKMKIKILFLIMILVTGFSCQEVYNPEDLDQSSKIPVVLGSVTEGKGPFTVTLYWASTFDGNRINYINGAIVSVLDDLGKVYPYKQIAPGFYRSDTNKLIGTSGRKYALKIVTLDDLTLESAFELLENKPIFDTIYAEAGSRVLTSKDAYGELITSTQNGLYIYTDYNALSIKPEYLKFNTLTVTQTLTIMKTPPENPPTLFCRNIGYYGTIPDIKATYTVGSYQVLKKHNIVFLPYIYDPYGETDTTQPPIIDGWLVNLTVSKISTKAYRYYQLIAEQLNASSRVFDPIPSKITGNISCKNDSLRTVLGLFEVASSSSLTYGFYWYPGASNYHSQKINGTGPLYDSCLYNEQPEGWVWIGKK